MFSNLNNHFFLNLQQMNVNFTFYAIWHDVFCWCPHARIAPVGTRGLSVELVPGVTGYAAGLDASV